MTTDEVNNAIIDTWDNHQKQQAAQGLNLEPYVPAVYPPFETGGLLCVGFNPSMPANRPAYFAEHFQKHPYQGFFEWTNREACIASMASAIQAEQHARENYPFYQKFKKIAQTLETEWNHVDLLFCRERNQHALKGRIYAEGQNAILNDFGREQLHLAKELITAAHPRMVLVANAEAARLFMAEFHLIFDNDHCCHRWDNDGKDVPVFLSSMLTGQRALDNFSYDRLLCLMQKEWNRHCRDAAH